MTNLNPITVYLMGLDPLTCLTPMDGVIRAIRRLNVPVTIIGVSSNAHDSGNILSLMFDDVIILQSKGEEQYHELVQRSVSGPKLLIPMGLKEAYALAPHHLWLTDSGFFCAAPTPLQAIKPEYETMEYLSQKTIEIVKWTNLLSKIDSSSIEFDYPLIMTTTSRLQKWIIPSKPALEVMLDRVLSQGQIPMVRTVGPETSYQVATVIDNNLKPAGWGMVLEIARNKGAEPWMFLSVQSKKLQKVAAKIARALEYKGPLTMRFVFSSSNNTYKLDSFMPLLPVWTDLAAHAGVNLAGRLLEIVGNRRVTDAPAINSPGHMITFNSFDISVSPETWLNIAGRGGYKHE